jgi:hypothetical protein
MKLVSLLVTVGLLAGVVAAAAVVTRPLDHVAVPAAPAFSRDYSVIGQPVRGRVYLFGSLNILSGPDLTAELVARGIQVVTLAIPRIDPDLYVEAGAPYRRSFATAVASVKVRVEAASGASRSLIGGGSIGGLHALMGYALVYGFDGWFASMPVTRLTALAEFFGRPEPSQFDPFHEMARLKNSNGLMTWGTADTRVDWRLSRQLWDAIGSPHTVHVEYAGKAHDTTPEQIVDLLNWIDRQF